MMPATLSSAALLIGALLGARGARVKTDQELGFEALVVKAGGSAGEVICGGDAIWDMLTASSTVQGIQNIKWAKIDTLAGDFLADMGAQKDGLEVEISQLKERIKEKKAQEAPAMTTEDELTKLLEDSLVPSFGSVEQTASTQCGLPSARPRAPRTANRESKKVFAEKADELLDETKRFDGDAFLLLCGKMLPEAQGSYCGHLCQQFKDKAQAISNERAGEAGGLLSDDLMVTLNEKQEKLASVKKDIHRCNKAQETLGAFRKQVGDLKDVQDVRFNELQEAEYALDDALYELEDLSIVLEKEEDALVQADEALTGEGEKVEALKQDIAKVRGEESSAKDRLTAGLKKLDDLRKELGAAKEATQKALDMKAALSSVMMMMRLFFDESVLEPLRMMGLDEEVEVEEFFGESKAKLAATGALGDAVDKLSDYCGTKARVAFAAVKDSVDLNPLCEMGEPSDFKKETLSAVNDKEALFASVLLNDIVGWLDPYHGNHGMTKEMAEQRVAEGETAGFQEIVGVYSRTKFFKYLKEWRKGGAIPKMLLSLEYLTGNLTISVGEAEQFVDGLESQLASVQQHRDKVIEELETAESELAKTADEHAEIARTVQELKDQTAAFKDNIEHLREQVRIAKENCKKADQALVDALEVLKSGWGEQHGLLEELRREELQAENKVILAKKAVTNSQNMLLAARHWAATNSLQQ